MNLFRKSVDIKEKNEEKEVKITFLLWGHGEDGLTLWTATPPFISSNLIVPSIYYRDVAQFGQSARLGSVRSQVRILSSRPLKRSRENCYF